MKNLPIILVAIAVLLVPVIWFVATSLSGDGDRAAGSLFAPSVDSAARIELEDVRQKVEFLSERVAALEAEVETLRAVISQQPNGGGGNDTPKGPNAIIDAYAEVVLIGDRRELNKGLRIASPNFLEGFLGRPRDTIDDTCRSMTNPKLANMLHTADVGPIKVRMLQPAIDSLRRVFENVRATDPDLYARINTAGSLCVRRIRGTQNSLSTHSFGLSLDLNIDGQLDTLGDGKTQLGLTILKDFFRDEGWIWGAAFGREDSMHFEVSRDLLERWRSEGLI